MMNLLKFEHGANFEQTSKENNISSNCEASNEEGFSIMQKAKKTAVAISGGALVAIGIPLIPLPGPGCLVVASGLSVLATEFPAAQKFLDEGKEKMKDFAETNKTENNEDGLGLGFEMVDDPDAPEETSTKNAGIEKLRTVTREKIIPMMEKLPYENEEEKSVNSGLGLYNVLSE